MIPRRSLVLIGLSGAGKSTVAPLAATVLGCAHVDIDALIAERAGCSIAEIFATRGESYFRELERAAVLEQLRDEPAVIAVGAGWPATPGNLAGVAGRALVVLLSLSPEEAARRLAGSTDRPLLGDAPMVERLARQLADRNRWYQLADIELAVGDASPEAVASGIVTAALQYGGW